MNQAHLHASLHSHVLCVRCAAGRSADTTVDREQFARLVQSVITDREVRACPAWCKGLQGLNAFLL